MFCHNHWTVIFGLCLVNGCKQSTDGQECVLNATSNPLRCTSSEFPIYYQDKCALLGGFFFFLQTKAVKKSWELLISKCLIRHGQIIAWFLTLVWYNCHTGNLLLQSEMKTSGFFWFGLVCGKSHHY